MPQDTITLTINGLNKTGAMFRTMNSSLSGMGGVVIAANQALNLLTTSIQLLEDAAGALVSPFADFQQETQNIRTLLQTTDADFNNLKQGILDVAKTTPKAISELTSATYDLISAGVDEENAIWALNQAQRAAVAGSTDTQVAVNGAMATINAYSLELSELTSVFDMQFNVVKRGVITFDELANNIGKVLPSAKNLGADLEEVHAGMALLTKAGFNAEQATTVLSRSFDALAKPSTVENFKEVGLAIHDQEGEFRGMVPILTDLAGKLETMSDAQRAELMGVLALEENALKGFSTLISKVEEYDSTITEMQGIGEMERAHEEMATTWHNRWDTMTNRVNVALIEWVDAHKETVDYILSSVEYVTRNMPLIAESVKVAFEGLYNTVKVVFNAITIAGRSALFAIATVVDGFAQLISYIPGLPESWKSAVTELHDFTTYAMNDLVAGIAIDIEDIKTGASGIGTAITEGMTLSNECEVVWNNIKNDTMEIKNDVDELNLKLQTTNEKSGEVKVNFSALNKELPLLTGKVKALVPQFEKIDNTLIDSEETLKIIGDTFAGSVSDGVGSVVKGMFEGEAAFESVADFAKSIATQLAVAVAQAIALKAVMSALGGIGFIFHQGGMVYHDGGIIRAHSGYLASDERMIIAQSGEAVLNRAAVNAIGGRPVIDYINQNKQLPATRYAGGGGGNTLIVNVDTMIGTDDWVKNNLIPAIESASEGGYSNIQLRQEELSVAY